MRSFLWPAQCTEWPKGGTKPGVEHVGIFYVPIRSQPLATRFRLTRYKEVINAFCLLDHGFEVPLRINSLARLRPTDQQGRRLIDPTTFEYGIQAGLARKVIHPVSFRKRYSFVPNRYSMSPPKLAT